MRRPTPFNIELSGIGASRGVIRAEALVIDRRRPEVPRYCVMAEAVEDEVARFERALEASIEQLKTITDSLAGTAASQHLYVLEAHQMVLTDPMVTTGTKEEIRAEQINAEWALATVLDRLLSLFEQVEDDYLRERAADVDFIGQRVLRNLAGQTADPVSRLRAGTILVAHDLSPADAAQLARAGVLGIATDLGGRTSHSAIMARSLGLPAVVGLKRITELVRDGDVVIVDGTRGVVEVRPDEGRIADADARAAMEQQRRLALAELCDLPAETRDGARVRLLANLDLPIEVEQLQKNGAEGVGLFRTEFLFVDREHAPTEDEHYLEYRKLVDRAGERPVTLRTYDLGGDKLLWSSEGHRDPNPALGVRGIRFALRNPELLILQFKAMYRAGRHGEVRILVPMVSGLKEWRRVKALAKEARARLEMENVPYHPEVALGPMIEVPSAAMIADQLAGESDFFSIGTNDLIQYLLAVDRDNEHVAELYESLHPAVLRVVRQVIDAARTAAVPVTMCGEMAGDPLNALVLLGLGLEEFSMTPAAIPWVKKILREGRLVEARQLASHLLELATAEEVAEHVRDWMAQRYPDLF